MHPFILAILFCAVAIALVLIASYVGMRLHKYTMHTPSPVDAHMNMVYVPRYHSYLLGLMREVDEELGRQGTPYWLGGGTLLGQARIGGMLPFDDDLDIVMEEDQLFKLLQVYDRERFVIFKKVPCGSIWRIRFKDRVLYEGSGCAEIDIFPLRRSVDGKKLVCFGYVAIMWPEHTFF